MSSRDTVIASLECWLAACNVALSLSEPCARSPPSYNLRIASKRHLPLDLSLVFLCNKLIRDALMFLFLPTCVQHEDEYGGILTTEEEEDEQETGDAAPGRLLEEGGGSDSQEDDTDEDDRSEEEDHDEDNDRGDHQDDSDEQDSYDDGELSSSNGVGLRRS